MRKNTPGTHDYIGIAVEFDNGQDINYVWSSTLARETVFRCPLPRWTAKETHLVVQVGTSQLNEALSYRRNIRSDYEHYVGRETPRRIVKIWVVVGTSFQGGHSDGLISGLSVSTTAAGSTDLL